MNNYYYNVMLDAHVEGEKMIMTFLHQDAILSEMTISAEQAYEIGERLMMGANKIIVQKRLNEMNPN